MKIAWMFFFLVEVVESESVVELEARVHDDLCNKIKVEKDISTNDSHIP